jgi:hypothetical protein
LRLIRDHDLGRFSAVVQTANGLFGLSWDSISVKVVNDTIDLAIALLTDRKARAKALASIDPEEIYLALWSVAFEDAEQSIALAAELLKHKKVEIRFVAATHLGRLGLPQTRRIRAAVMDDDDLRVALCALEGSTYYGGQDEEEEAEPIGGDDGYFEHLERLFQRLPPKPTTLKPLV